MKLTSFLQLALLATTTFAADSAARFKKYHTKSLSSAPLKLDDASFEELTTTPRDYTAVVLLTAMPAQFGCQLCKEFQPEFDILGKSWIGGDKKGESKVVFGTLDFPDGKGTFQKV
jgi:oligosaccharyltransferase complex subunit gamma